MLRSLLAVLLSDIQQSQTQAQLQGLVNRVIAHG